MWRPAATAASQRLTSTRGRGLKRRSQPGDDDWINRRVSPPMGARLRLIKATIIPVERTIYSSGVLGN